MKHPHAHSQPQQQQIKGFVTTEKNKNKIKKDLQLPLQRLS
jgi:hypothetical protein